VEAVMTARAARFRQSDITRAAAGMMKAGVREYRIEIDPNGKMVIVASPTAALAGGNSWDDVK
jgi:hypothetical protein